MWIKGKHVAVDNQGRPVKRDITVNMGKVICYIALDEERTRLYCDMGHDLEDHRNASWIDLEEPKSKLDGIIGKQKEHVR